MVSIGSDEAESVECGSLSHIRTGGCKHTTDNLIFFCHGCLLELFGERQQLKQETQTLRYELQQQVIINTEMQRKLAGQIDRYRNDLQKAYIDVHDKQQIIDCQRQLLQSRESENRGNIAVNDASCDDSNSHQAEKAESNRKYPSEAALKWRINQIECGKHTQGYRNFTRLYPDLLARARLSEQQNVVTTPDAILKIGKKRWVGKYQKWRAFLHTFEDGSRDKNVTANTIEERK
eukprot:CAMPEP_0202704746 /NCGR_PEP_ID=MMETSP1385-20130828/17384_1 /ASSEMBLY_ACC=CAM_ASM_000861 /TAXON_ID=933848 /ORGANISM="Elphidium margaritaceum" /LENGTH=233 /DNA_ID=CAMNT_0049362839 /DNA_START=38 /DNA_END=739 /DNA_ORIENTATION=+